MFAKFYEILSLPFQDIDNFTSINMSYSLKSGTFGPDFEEKKQQILKKKSVLLMLVSVLSLQF